MSKKLPALKKSSTALTAADLMPVQDIAQAIARRNAITQFVKELMIDGTDFGKIPGVDKPSLLKPGAEKLVTFFGLSPEFVLEAKVEDWTGADHKNEPFFYYRYRARLTRGGRLLGEGEGSCNSWESKYRYRWVPATIAAKRPDYQQLETRGGQRTIFEPDFALTKRETGGKYGKPDAHWNMFDAAIARAQGKAPAAPAEGDAARFSGLDLDGEKPPIAVRGSKKMGAREYAGWSITVNELQYRIPNPDVADIVNTLQKMSQKRALVAAVLVGVNASEFFTQDVEDMQMIDVPAGATPAATTGGANAAAEDATIVSETKRTPGVGPDVAGPGETKRAPAQDPLHPTDADAVEVDTILKFKEAGNMGALTEIFNKLPADWRRPGTKLYDAFKERRKQLGGE